MNTKKLSLAIAAIAMTTALAWAASDTNKSPRLLTTTMYYHGPSFNQADVQNKAYWNTTAEECTPGEDKACQATVDASLVSGGSFISSVSLEAESGSSAALLDIKNSGTSVEPDIINRN